MRRALFYIPLVILRGAAGWSMTGFILGGVIGSLVALLITPSSGSEMRLKIKNNYQHVRSEVEMPRASAVGGGEDVSPVQQTRANGR